MMMEKNSLNEAICNFTKICMMHDDKNGTRVNEKPVNLQCVFAYDDLPVFLKSNVS